MVPARLSRLCSSVHFHLLDAVKSMTGSVGIKQWKYVYLTALVLDKFTAFMEMHATALVGT